MCVAVYMYEVLVASPRASLYVAVCEDLVGLRKNTAVS